MVLRFLAKFSLCCVMAYSWFSAYVIFFLKSLNWKSKLSKLELDYTSSLIVNYRGPMSNIKGNILWSLEFTPR